MWESKCITTPESIEWFIEGQAFSGSGCMILAPRPTSPLPFLSVSSTGDTQEDWERETSWCRETGGRGGSSEGGKELNQTTARKPGPLEIIPYSLQSSIPSVSYNDDFLLSSFLVQIGSWGLFRKRPVWYLCRKHEIFAEVCITKTIYKCRLFLHYRSLRDILRARCFKEIWREVR